MKKIYSSPSIQVIHLSVEDLMLTGSLTISSREVDGADAFSNREPADDPIWGNNH